MRKRRLHPYTVAAYRFALTAERVFNTLAIGAIVFLFGFAWWLT